MQNATNWPTDKYGVILADPPWQYEVFNDSKAAYGAARAHYPTMSLQELAALPVKELALTDCALFMWATCPLLPDAIHLMQQWGFKYKTVGFTWTKTNPSGLGWYSGLGHWTNSNIELCLLGTRGRPRRIAKNVKQLLIWPRREHSRKPDEQYGRIERLVGGPYIELFARRRWPGWDAWGNEVEPITEQRLAV